MDPLTVIRDCYISNRLSDVVLEARPDGDRYVLKDGQGKQYVFPADFVTAYKSSSGSYLTMDTIIYFMQHRTDPSGQYMTNSTTSRPGRSFVSMVDRKASPAWLICLSCGSGNFLHCILECGNKTCIISSTFSPDIFFIV